MSLLMRTRDRPWRTVGNIVKRSGKRPWYITYMDSPKPTAPLLSEEVTDAVAGAQRLHALVLEGKVYDVSNKIYDVPRKMKARLPR